MNPTYMHCLINCILVWFGACRCVSDHKKCGKHPSNSRLNLPPCLYVGRKKLYMHCTIFRQCTFCGNNFRLFQGGVVFLILPIKATNFKVCPLIMIFSDTVVLYICITIWWPMCQASYIGCALSRMDYLTIYSLYSECPKRTLC